MSSPKFRADLSQIGAYQIPDSTNLIKLDAMENPYPFPSALLHQWTSLLTQSALNRYPDSNSSALKELIYEKLHIPRSSAIMFGNGSDELITLITQSIAAPNACVLAPTPSFVMYRTNAFFCQVRFINFMLDPNGFSIDSTNFLQVIQKEKPALVWLSYPNNPTGNLFDDQLIEQILITAPDSLVVLDEAYQPFAKKTWSSRLPEFNNLLILRTLSKLGLAGIRFGYLAGHTDIINQINKLRPPYNINVLTTVTAELALKNYPLFEQQTDQINLHRAQLFDQLNQIENLHVFNSHANFLLFKIKSSLDMAIYVHNALKNNFRILIKDVSKQADSLHNCLRVSIGTAEENQYFLTAIKQIMENLPN